MVTAGGWSGDDATRRATIQEADDCGDLDGSLPARAGTSVCRRPLGAGTRNRHHCASANLYPSDHRPIPLALGQGSGHHQRKPFKFLLRLEIWCTHLLSFCSSALVLEFIIFCAPWRGLACLDSQLCCFEKCACGSLESIDQKTHVMLWFSRILILVVLPNNTKGREIRGGLSKLTSTVASHCGGGGSKGPQTPHPA